jgi:hypothetical protein
MRRTATESDGARFVPDEAAQPATGAQPADTESADDGPHPHPSDQPAS